MSTPDPSPTEEELAVILAHARSAGCVTADRLEPVVFALRSARETARVAMRERDEARLGEDAQRRERLKGEDVLIAKLTDRDRMIAEVRAIFDGQPLYELPAAIRAPLVKFMRGSHPIAAAFEARLTSLDQQVTNMQRVSAEHYADRLSLESQLRAHEETIGRLRAAGQALHDSFAWMPVPTNERPQRALEAWRDALAAAPPGEYEQRVQREERERIVNAAIAAVKAYDDAPQGTSIRTLIDRLDSFRKQC